MKIVRVRYIPPLGPMVQDLQRVFPELPITGQYLQNVGGILINPAKKRFVYLKDKFNEQGVRTKVIAYMLVKDSFTVPAWVQGTVLDPLDPDDVIDHWFLGHEILMPDDPNEAPEEVIA